MNARCDQNRFPLGRLLGGKGAGGRGGGGGGGVGVRVVRQGLSEKIEWLVQYRHISHDTDRAKYIDQIQRQKGGGGKSGKNAKKKRFSLQHDSRGTNVHIFKFVSVWRICITICDLQCVFLSPTAYERQIEDLTRMIRH
jgi:hypothetical protein